MMARGGDKVASTKKEEFMPSQSKVKRRDFLKKSTKLTASLAALRGVTFLTRPERVFGANDRVRVAVCGLHGRGKDHLSGFSRLANVEVAALCDVDENLLKGRLGTVPRPQTFIDVRKLLEDKSNQANSIAPPHHRAGLKALWGLQGGKEGYVEKPC